MGYDRLRKELSEIFLFVTAFLFMMKFNLKSDMAFATCVAPLFYYTICLSVLRVCLFFKAMFFLFKKLFTCFKETKARGIFR